MEHDRCLELEARLSFRLLVEVKVWIKLEHKLTGLCQGAHHIGIAFDLPDVCDALLSDVVAGLFLLNLLDLVLVLQIREVSFYLRPTEG